MSLGNRQYVGENDTVHPRDAIEAVPVAPVTSPAPTARISASALILVGIATVLVAIWGGIAPFIGPTFGFSADGASAWNLSDAHLLLGVLPGAVAFVAGVLILVIAPRTLSWSGRGSLAGAGLLAVMAGAWFVVGPVARPVLSTSGSYYVVGKSASRARVPDRLFVRPGIADRNGRGVHAGMVGAAPANQQSVSEHRIGRPAREYAGRGELGVRPRREPVARRGPSSIVPMADVSARCLDERFKEDLEILLGERKDHRYARTSAARLAS